MIVAMSTSTPIGTLKFDDVISSNLMNEVLQCKSIIQNQGGESLTLVDHERKIDRNRQGHSRSRGRSKLRRGRLTCYHHGKLGHMKNEC
jgi:hypothetical protein